MPRGGKVSSVRWEVLHLDRLDFHPTPKRLSFIDKEKPGTVFYSFVQSDGGSWVYFRCSNLRDRHAKSSEVVNTGLAIDVEETSLCAVLLLLHQKHQRQMQLSAVQVAFSKPPNPACCCCCRRLLLLAQLRTPEQE